MRQLRAYSIELILILVLGLAVAYFAYLGYGLTSPRISGGEFDGARALEFAGEQMDFGPRITGSSGNIRTGDWLVDELRTRGWDVVIQPYTVTVPLDPAEADNLEAPLGPVEARNIIAIRGDTSGNAPVALVVTHYDTRILADGLPAPETPAPDVTAQDEQPAATPDEAGVGAEESTSTEEPPQQETPTSAPAEPVPGANSGAAGTATLLELARTLDTAVSGHVVCLVFLDMEANRGLDGWQPPYGSEFLMVGLDENIPRCRDPRFALYLDMVGGADVRLLPEPAADQDVTDAIWQTAAPLGFQEQFATDARDPFPGPHQLFIDAGISTAVLADPTYAFRHTTADTLDKLSEESLHAVGRTLEVWLEAGAPIVRP